MPENLYPKFPSAPSINQESFNAETIRKYYQDIANLKEKYNEKQWKYENAYKRLLQAYTGDSSIGVITLYNVCSVHQGMFSTSGGYHEYIGGIS